MTQLKWLAVSVMALTAAAGCESGSDTTAPTAETFTVAMNGTSERPTPVTTPAVGTGTFTLSADGNTLSWTLTMTSANNVTASHIHVGGKEIAGPIVLPLFASAATNNPAISGSVTRATFVSPLGVSFDGLIALMRNGDTYANVHTDNGVAPTNTGPGDFPGGEIRGQIARVQ